MRFKAGRMEEMVLKRWLELENSFRNMHAEIDSSIVPEKCIASISVWTSWSWQQ